MNGRRLAALAVPVGVALVALAAAAPTTRWRAAAAQELGSSPPSTVISFGLSLRLDERRLRADLAAGTSVSSAAALGARYGLSRADERRVERILTANGITVSVSTPSERDRRTGERSHARRFFHVGFHDYAIATDRRFLAPTREPTIPGRSRGTSRGCRPQHAPVRNLRRRAARRARATRRGLAYDLTPLHEQGLDGTGQTIAVVSFEAFPPDYSTSQADIKTFEAPSGPGPGAEGHQGRRLGATTTSARTISTSR